MRTTAEDLVVALKLRRLDLERAAESLGVAAQAVDSATLSASQLRLIADGLREVQGELHDVSDSLRSMVRKEEVFSM